MDLIEQIERYVPFNEQEEKDKLLILSSMRSFEDIFLRENALAHMTASAWVLNKSHDKALMAYHNIYDSWAWLGGHADGERNLLQTAVREVREESGIREICPISEEIFSIEALTVDGHIKRGSYVSSHMHLNITYLLEADDTQPLAAREGENSKVAWFLLEDASNAPSEKWMCTHIYSKLKEKTSIFLSAQK